MYRGQGVVFEGHVRAAEVDTKGVLKITKVLDDHQPRTGGDVNHWGDLEPVSPGFPFLQSRGEPVRGRILAPGFRADSSGMGDSWESHDPNFNLV